MHTSHIVKQQKAEPPNMIASEHFMLITAGTCIEGVLEHTR